MPVLQQAVSLQHSTAYTGYTVPCNAGKSPDEHVRLQPMITCWFIARSCHCRPFAGREAEAPQLRSRALSGTPSLLRGLSLCLSIMLTPEQGAAWPERKVRGPSCREGQSAGSFTLLPPGRIERLRLRQACKGVGAGWLGWCRPGAWRADECSWAEGEACAACS